MNNLDFIDIKKNKKVTKLYNEAFPKDERIPIWLLKILVRKNKAKFYGIYDNEKFVGLVYNIFYKDIVFVFYLAIDKGTREQGYGTKVLDSIKQKYKNSRIILCIEPVDENSDNYEQRVKRKNFYLKNGFEDSNYIIKERNIIYEMLYYNENVALQEFEEMMKNYFGKMLYEKFYKK